MDSTYSNVYSKKMRSNMVPWFKKKLLLYSIVLVIFLILQSLLAGRVKVPYGSMLPTIHTGDHVLVNKMAYEVHLPFSDFFYEESITLQQLSKPRRVDIVLFLNPQEPGICHIKRILAVAGDVIEVKDKIVYLNQKMVQQAQATKEKTQKILGGIFNAQYQKPNIRLLKEFLPAEENSTILEYWIIHDERRQEEHILHYGPITVPAGHIFVMGDNRDHASHSREWGFVPLVDVRGRVWRVLYNFFLSSRPFLINFQGSRSV